MKPEPTPQSPSTASLKVQLPATPKSSNGEEASDASSAGREDNPLVEKGQDEVMDSDSHSRHDMEVDQPEEKHFVLAPTPAQLGKAPLQRRLASSCSQDSAKDLSPTSTKSGSTANSGSCFTAFVGTPGPLTSDEQPLTSANSKKKQFFKKAKNDDMDT